MDNYHDRGIIKWLPFDGLLGFYDLVKDLRYRLNKKEMPILSDDLLFEMDLIIKEAIYYNKEILISYFNDGYIKEYYGLVTKVDQINNIIYLNNYLKLHIRNIINLELI